MLLPLRTEITVMNHQVQANFVWEVFGFSCQFDTIKTHLRRRTHSVRDWLAQDGL